MGLPVNATGTKLYAPSGTSASYTGITIASGTNTVLLVVITFDTNAVIGGVSCTWDSGGTNQSMTSIVNTAQGKDCFIFGLVAPTTGNKTLAVSWTGTVRPFIDAIAYNSANQTGGTTTFYGGVTGAGVATVNVSSAVGDSVISIESSGVSQGTATGTLLFDDHVSGTVINAMSNYMDGAASVAIGNSGTNAAIAACGIKAAAAAAARQQTLTLLGCGA